MTKTTTDKQELLNAAYSLFCAEADEVSRKDAVKILRDLAPGFTDRQYRTAWNRVSALFDNACRLVFRWGNDNPPGTTFELPDKDRIFLDELAKLSRGFSETQYHEALEYGFRKSIF